MSLDEESLSPGLQEEIEKTVHQLIWDSPISGMDLKVFLGPMMRAWMRMGHTLSELTALMFLRDPRLEKEVEALEVADDPR